jgi:hypothetical protein
MRPGVVRHGGHLTKWRDHQARPIRQSPMSVVRVVPIVIFLCLAVPASVQFSVPPVSAQAVGNPVPLWEKLIADVKTLRLPAKFLEQIPGGFVRFEFDDLRTFAAEYHPTEHRMVLNRTLSFNQAGGTLRPLRQLTHKDLQTLYHELFHAYMDYLTGESSQPSAGGRSADSLITFAREQQHCRYGRVLITPVPQRKNQTEERFLSEEESWEMLNETWAVFVGWAIWTRLELGQSKSDRAKSNQPTDSAGTQEWIERLRAADREADLRGYYEPQDPAEKAIAQKRFAAPAFRISAQEVKRLMNDVLESSPDRIARSVQMLEKDRPGVPAFSCGATAGS